MGKRLRASALLVLLLSTGGAAATPTVNPELVDYYSPSREDALFARPSPVIAEYRHGDLDFGFAGAVHASDPSSPTFRMIDRAFRTIRPKAVILEGFPTSWGANPPHVMREINTSDASNSYAVGEDIYAARLALRSGAAIWGTEPDDSQLASELRRLGFTARDIFFASMFGPLAQDLDAKLFTGPDDPAFDTSYAKWAKLNSKDYDPTAPTDAGAFKAWFRKNYGRALRDDPEWFTRGGPGQKGIAGAIGRASSRIRDQHMVAVAMRLLQENKRVLLVAGRSHLSDQWRALRAALGPPRVTFEPPSPAHRR